MINLIIFLSIINTIFDDTKLENTFIQQLEDRIIQQRDYARELHYQDKLDSIISEHVRTLCNKNLVLIMKCNDTYNQMIHCEFEQEKASLQRNYTYMIYNIINNIDNVQMFLRMSNFKITRF